MIDTVPFELEPCEGGGFVARNDELQVAVFGKTREDAVASFHDGVRELTAFWCQSWARPTPPALFDLQQRGPRLYPAVPKDRRLTCQPRLGALPRDGRKYRMSEWVTITETVVVPAGAIPTGFEMTNDPKGPIEEPIDAPDKQDPSPDLPSPLEGNEDEDDTEGPEKQDQQVG